MKYSLYEGTFYRTIEKYNIRYPTFLTKFAGCEFYYTFGNSDPFSVAICNGDDCRILYDSGLYRWIGVIRSLSIMDTLIMTDMTYDSAINGKAFNSEKIREFMDNISSKKLQGVFMGDWFPEGKLYVKACSDTLKYFYDSAQKRRNSVRVDAILCATLDNILNHDTEKDDDNYYINLAKEYNYQKLPEKGRNEVYSEFKGRIYGRLSTLIRQKYAYMVDRKIDNHQTSLLDF